MIGNGTNGEGSRNGLSKLTEEDVVQARIDYSHMTIGALAKRHGVSRSTMSYAVSGKTWSHLPMNAFDLAASASKMKRKRGRRDEEPGVI